MLNFILGLIIGGAGVWVMMRKRKINLNPMQSEHKEQNLEKVMAIAREKGEIRNDDIQYVLGVSDATAERYLGELEAQGKLVQIGEKKGTIYRAK